MTRPGLERVVVRGQFTQARADHQQDVRVLQEVGRVAVLQPGLEGERVFPGKAPLPPKVVTTGAFSFSASRRSLPDASDRTTPPPAMIAGRAACDSNWAATAVEFGARDDVLGVASIAVTTGRAVSARRTSCGISTQHRAVRNRQADSHAAAIADGIWDWLRTVWTDFTTPLNDACWSGSSCR